MRRRWWLLCLLAWSCGPNTPSTPTATVATSTATAADLAFCIQDTNALRARVGAAPVLRDTTLEAFAADGARLDAASGVIHQHFQLSGPSLPGNRYENEILNIDAASLGTIQAAMHAMNNLWFAEGPSGGHYQNTLGPQVRLGCGVFLQKGLITIVQDFQ